MALWPSAKYSYGPPVGHGPQVKNRWARQKYTLSLQQPLHHFKQRNLAHQQVPP